MLKLVYVEHIIETTTKIKKKKSWTRDNHTHWHTLIE